MIQKKEKHQSSNWIQPSVAEHIRMTGSSFWMHTGGIAISKARHFNVLATAYYTTQRSRLVRRASNLDRSKEAMPATNSKKTCNG